MDSKPFVPCGARNRQGEPCKKRPMKGKKRCLAHGGKTPAKQNSGKDNGNHKHGLYGAYLTETEKSAWDTIPLGDVDHEIRMCKVWLSRALALEASIAADANSTKNMAGFELSEVRHSSSERGKSTDAVSKRPDVMARVNWLFGRIAQLEKTRTELLTAAAGKEDLSVRFVVEIPAEEPMAEWMKDYGADRQGD